MRNIIITGGELFNKGAQAMTFLTVSALKKRFPRHEIYVLSELDLERSEKEKSQYAFRFMGWFPRKFAKAQSNPLLHLLCRIRNGAELKAANSIYKNTDLMVDISGYGLGSIWSHATCHKYLDHLEFARAYGIPVYLLPQSFGPFNYKDSDGQSIFARCKELLPYCKVIYAREQESCDALVSHFGLSNVVLAKDLVLCGGEADTNAVFTTPPVLSLPPIAENAVAVIPNQRNNRAGDSSALELIYRDMIRQLLSMGKTVYLLCHSTHDVEICRTLKDHFREDDRVIYLPQDFSCIEFNQLVQRFDFLVASRFHSIVHAYKNGIPCIALGWAEKYRQLLTIFHQEQYLFDVRNNPDSKSICDAIQRLDTHRNEEAEAILAELPALRQEDIFLSTTFSLKEST